MATAQSLTRNIDRTLAYTDETLVPDVKFLQFQKSPAAEIFLGDEVDQSVSGGMSVLRGAGKRVQTGGAKVQINHAVESNSTVQMMAGAWSTYDTTPQDFVRRSEADWKHGSGTRTLSLTDELINTGPDAIADHLATETRNVMGSAVDLWAVQVYSGSSANEITGLDSLIGAGDTVQGLSGATYAVWNSRGLSARNTAAASVSFASGSFAAQGISDMRIGYDNASEGSNQPNVILSDYTERQYYEGTLVPAERYAAPASVGDASFQRLLFRGAAWLPDPNATSGVIYLVNTDCTYVKFLAGADFQFQPWKHATQQESRTSELVTKGQTCIDDRRLSNKLTGVIA